MRLNMIMTYILACSMGVISFGCSTVGLGKKEDTKKEETKLVEIPKSKTPNDIPDWFLEKQEDNDRDLTATATGVSKDMQFSIDKATLDAKVQLAAKLGTKIDSLTRETSLESGYGVKDVNREIDRVSKVRVNQQLNFFRREHVAVVREGEAYRAFVMLKISKEDGRRLTQKDNSTSREERLKELDKDQ
jgi:hypothetical protein